MVGVLVFSAEVAGLIGAGEGLSKKLGCLMMDFSLSGIGGGVESSSSLMKICLVEVEGREAPSRGDGMKGLMNEGKGIMWEMQWQLYHLGGCINCRS